MVQARKKNRWTAKRKFRKRIWLALFLGLAVSLALFFFLRTKPVEKRAEEKVIHPMPPPLPAPAKPAEGMKEEEKEREKAKEKAPVPSARLALIIDDGGYNLEKFEGMMVAGKSMTFAVLPNTPHAREAARLAHARGQEVMLHLPMEPRESERYSLERDTVLVGMTQKEIGSILKRDLAQIPYARGINNHMGSKATEDRAVMGALMEVLKKEGLFYVDSHTSPRSVGREMARGARVPFGSNDRFIDHGSDLASIKKEIRRAMKKAKRDGKAIAIGHPNPWTAQAIREMVPEIEGAGIKMVFASEVVD
jgi:polysaccharide deacetylase 2 family uncharacterized protein YibQ